MFDLSKYQYEPDMMVEGRLTSSNRVHKKRRFVARKHSLEDSTSASEGAEPAIRLFNANESEDLSEIPESSLGSEICDSDLCDSEYEIKSWADIKVNGQSIQETHTEYDYLTVTSSE